MPKNKRPAKGPAQPSRKSAPAPGHDLETQAQNLVDLALDIAEGEQRDPSTLAARENDVRTLVRRALRRRHDELLYGAIDLARYTEPAACRYLRERIDEEAATLIVRQDGGAELEIDAFMIPLFVHSTGGLVESQVFADDAAFEELSDSFRQAGLASANTKLVLVRHLYDIAEVDAIRYGELQDMLQEAAQAMRAKKLVATPTIERSIRGWEDTGYEPDDEAVELRFMLGFALKDVDDPFYRVPDDEAGADAYYEGRMARYRLWAGGIAPLLARCLSTDRTKAAELELDFLYQDLFYGAKAQGLDELAMLATLSKVNWRIDELGRAAERLKAVVAPVDLGEEAVLRMNLYPLDGGAPLASIDKPVDLSADLESELDDLCEALGSVGLDGVLVAQGFDAGGQPEGAEPYLND